MRVWRRERSPSKNEMRANKWINNFVIKIHATCAFVMCSVLTHPRALPEPEHQIRKTSFLHFSLAYDFPHRRILSISFRSPPPAICSLSIFVSFSAWNIWFWSEFSRQSLYAHWRVDDDSATHLRRASVNSYAATANDERNNISHFIPWREECLCKLMEMMIVNTVFLLFFRFSFRRFEIVFISKAKCELTLWYDTFEVWTEATPSYIGR